MKRFSRIDFMAVKASHELSDLVMVSIHWGGNWGYRVPREQIDYEGISGHEEFRGDLGVMYFPMLAGDSAELLDLKLVAPEIDCQWLCGALNAEGERFGRSFELRPRSRFALRIPGS